MKARPEPAPLLDRTYDPARTCSLWPECACYRNYYDWRIALDDDERIFDLNELKAAIGVIWNTLCCMAAHCPEPELKADADRQSYELQERKPHLYAKIHGTILYDKA